MLILRDFLSYIRTLNINCVNLQADLNISLHVFWWHDGHFYKIVSFINVAKLFNKGCSISLTCMYQFHTKLQASFKLPLCDLGLNQEQHVFIPSWCNFCRYQTRSIPIFTCPINILDLDVDVVEHVVHPRFIKQGLQMNKH